VIFQANERKLFVHGRICCLLCQPCKNLVPIFSIKTMTKHTTPYKSAIYNRTEQFSRMHRQNAPMLHACISCLIKLLRTYGLWPGISNIELKLFESYLSDREQVSFVNGAMSAPKSIVCGVPQGSILGPLLFLLYINDLPDCLEKSTPC
jgi:hypothetical protein